MEELQQSKHLIVDDYSEEDPYKGTMGPKPLLSLITILYKLALTLIAMSYESKKNVHL